MSDEKTLTWGQIYKEFCEWSPTHAKMVVDYRPWGSTSIVVWLNNGQVYKCKRYTKNKFIMQTLSENDINKKFNI